MTRRDDPPAVLAVKAKAKAMRQLLVAQGHSHVRLSHCLEELSHQAGYRNWNTYGALLRRGQA